MALLEQLELYLKTLVSLNLKISDGTANKILNGKSFEFTNYIFRLILELEQSKIETWNRSIYSK